MCTPTSICTYICIDRCMDGWMDGWMDGYLSIYLSIYIYIYLYKLSAVIILCVFLTLPACEACEARTCHVFSKDQHVALKKTGTGSSSLWLWQHSDTVSEPFQTVMGQNHSLTKWKAHHSPVSEQETCGHFHAYVDLYILFDPSLLEGNFDGSVATCGRQSLRSWA